MTPDHLSFAGLFLAGVGFVWGFVRLARHAPVIDRPNGRSSHLYPTPRTGGLALAAGVWLIMTLHRALDPAAAPAPGHLTFIALSATALGLGLADDLRLLGYRSKFGGQLGLAVLFALLVAQFDRFPIPGFDSAPALPPMAGFAVTVLWIVGFLNVFNFMDGLNGMAGGTALVAALFLALFSASAGDPFGVGVGLAVAVAAGGFLIDNLRGRIFMGDSGSHFLGFVLAGAVVHLAQNAGAEAGFNPMVGGVLFAPFLLDSAITILRRAARGAPVHEAHRDHLYQRLHRSGWSHLEVSALYAACGVGCGVAATVIHRAAPDLAWGTAFGVSAVLIGLGLGLERTISLRD